ncbi:MAG TPA: indolepyruvate oxidoreductase subunit beta [Thermodesulfobacteriota bacterium]|nr:indolepyruvate oxidoreductase subunit beta [Thermodesulfobacteriota bacterium]
MFISKDPFNVIIGGVGGQGNVLASQILGEMLVSQRYVVTIGETYGASQRGGAVMSHLRISARDQFSPLIPEGQCDLLVALEPVEGLRILDQYGNPRVMTLLNVRPIHPMDVISGNVPYPEISEVVARIKELSRRVWTLNATEVALEMGDPIFANIVMLGALCGIEALPIKREGFELVIKDLLPSRTLDQNLKAFDRGKEAVQEITNRK